MDYIHHHFFFAFRTGILPEIATHISNISNKLSILQTECDQT
jgi:hypothetical protein